MANTRALYSCFRSKQSVSVMLGTRSALHSLQDNRSKIEIKMIALYAITVTETMTRLLKNNKLCSTRLIHNRTNGKRSHVHCPQRP